LGFTGVNNKKRYLIATANEQTWKFDRPVIFLGEWCKLFSREHIWQNMDVIVAMPYGLGQLKKDADYAEARQLEEKIFPLLCKALNDHHKVKHDERFWKIILGHWFRRYVDVILNRFKTLKSCLDAYDISGITLYENDQYPLAPLDSNSAIWAFNDARWNDALTFQILSFLGNTNFAIEYIKENSFLESHINISRPKKPFLKYGYEQLSKLMSLIVRNTDALIINSYLPFKEEIKLHLLLGQFPQFWYPSNLQIQKKPDLALRQNLNKKFYDYSSKNLEGFLFSMLFKLIPICYLEGFKDLNNFSKKMPWPRNPKFIFTSNNFDTDERFKCWTANKTAAGCKYIVGQHGNNYGSHRYLNPSLEEITADKFLTWGWTEKSPKHIPAFIFKTVGKKSKVYNRKGGLLLIETHLNHRITTWDDTSEFSSYFEEQQKFISNLTISPKKQLTIRLPSVYKNYNWDELARWQKFDSSLEIEAGELNINILIAKNRLIVYSYDSTGILETLSQNIPTIAFWQNKLDHLRESAKPFYEALIDAGIVHLNPISAANKTNEIWDEVDKWWFGSRVQKARIDFCNEFAKQSKKPIRELKQILSDSI
jgi:putative transferase (TIGR04331 family)